MKHSLRISLMTSNIFILIFIYILISGAIVPILGPVNNEISKKIVIGMKSNLDTEYDSLGRKFWWVEDKKALLRFTNDSDESIAGNIILNLSRNPCNSEGRISIFSGNNEIKSLNLNQDEKKVKIGYYVIKPYSEADVFLTAQVDNFCELTNGDERKLTAQITGWAFE